MTQLFFVTATGTGVGKTFVSRGLSRALVRRGLAVAAVKPLETGCQPEPEDAHALGRACSRPELTHAPGLYRAPLPLAPGAATLAGCPQPPPIAALAATLRELVAGADLGLVEGAGGLLVPYDEHEDLADLAAELEAPLLVVAPDALGTLSHTLSLVACARARGLPVTALVLVRKPLAEPDPSRESNARILAERLPGIPLFVFAESQDDDDDLADRAELSGLAEWIAARIAKNPS